jgi:redox-sensitive bicupin YhaK (pirin superfamily)|tara:strand:+ start:4717 stop:5598 length:882 start_codon:yes stop_codon:yes gene_type:complete
MAVKEIELVIPPRNPHFVGDGFRVQNFIPSAYGLDMQRMSPFIMLDYNAPFHFPATDTPRGVGVHPHRGFETVTLAYQGSVAHHDSGGNQGIIGPGGVQWMTAASGVLHKEYHEAEFAKKGGVFQMVQLWVNLPAAHKMSPPKYQGFSEKDIPTVHLDREMGHVKVVAGNYLGTPGAATTFTEVQLYNVHLNDQGKASFSFPAQNNTAVLVLSGNISIASHEETIEENHLVLFKNEGESFEITANQVTDLLVLSGSPINEPIAAQGPFVMNTQAEIAQAIRDFHTGGFGVLED